jgi:DNA polymerase-1
MRTLTHVVAGDTCYIFIPERPEDMRDFPKWMTERANKPLAVDTETTGLNVFGRGFGLRLLQIGDEGEAWVLRDDLAKGWGAKALRDHDFWVAHSFAYDSQVIERCLGVTIEEMTPKVFDTIILSKLVEPHRVNHQLKPLSEQYVDQFALDTAEGLYGEFRRLGFTKDTGWAAIPFENELYVRYAGLDVIYCARLLPVLAEKAKGLMLGELSKFEHTIQGYLNMMRRKGMRVDTDYANAQQQNFLAESAEHLEIVRNDFGLDNLNSSKQVEAALLASGAELTERTPSGSFKTGKDVLWPLAGLDEFGGEIEDFENPNMLAFHVARGKRAERFANAYLGKFLDLVDDNGYIHPDTTGLQARTSRMAVSNPPLQQLPSKDWKVRRAIIADPGMSIISADYEQIELRLIAAMANVKKMKEAILQGLDLHGYTAELAYGPDYTKQQRTHMKGAGFGIAYGGGAKGLSRKLGISVAQATAVVKAYTRVYPEIKRWSLQLQRTARRNGMVMRSPTNRILALDRDRIYAAINYQVQSTAADVLKNALETLWTQGLGDYLLMPVHDEVVAQAPKEDAEDVARAIKKAMATEIMGLPIDSDAEVYGPSWGHGYADSPDKKQALAAFDYTLAA